MNASKTSVLLAVLSFAPCAHALDYKLSFEGLVTDTSGSVGHGIGVGTAVNGFLIYNADSPPDEVQGELHYYYNAVSAFAIDMASFQGSIPPVASFTFIQVASTSTADQVQINLGLTDPFASFQTLLNLPLGNLNGALPKSLPPFTSALSPGGSFFFEEDPSNPSSVSIAWSNLSVAPIPEPSTWAFLIGGLGLLALRLKTRA